MVNDINHEISISNPIDYVTLREDYHAKGQPVILKNIVSEWPALEKWSPNYFMHLFGDELITLSYRQNDRDNIQPSDEKTLNNIANIPFNQAMQNILESPKNGKSYFLMPLEIPRNKPELFKQLQTDFTLPHCLTPSQNYFTCFWLTGRQHLSPLHYERPNVLLTQVSGKKTVKLYHPADSHYLYPRSYGDIKGDNTSYYHFSQLALANESDKQHLFPLTKLAKPYIGELEPGDALFMPAGWWHEIVSETLSISIGYLWKTTLTQCALNQVMRHIGWYLFNHQRFDDIQQYIDISEFNDYYTIALYALENKHYWLAVLFGLADFYHQCNENDQKLLKILTSDNASCSQEHPDKMIRGWLELRDIARKENNMLLDSYVVDTFLRESKSYYKYRH